MAKKVKAENVPFIYPNIEILHQIDFNRDDSKPTDPETNIHKYGCCFMCNLAIPQYINRRALKKSDVIHIYGISVENGWLTQTCSVQKPEEIIRYAAALLKDNKHRYTNFMVRGVAPGTSSWNVDKHQNTASLPGKGNVYFCVVDFLTGSTGEYGGHHFQLFSGVGNLMYDPAKGTVNIYKDVNKIVFYRVD